VKISLAAILGEQFQTMLIGRVGLRLTLWRLDFFKVRIYRIANAEGWACFAFRYLDSRFACIKFNGLAPCLFQDFARILDTLPTPNTVLVPLNVIGASVWRSGLPSIKTQSCFSLLFCVCAGANRHLSATFTYFRMLTRQE
jgi:hypothetical protein